MSSGVVDHIKNAGLSGLFHVHVYLAGVMLSALTAVTALAEPLVLDAKQASPGYDQRTKEPVVTYILSEPSRRLLADFTTKNVGQPVELRVNGAVIMKVIIREPILGGQGQIVGDLTLEQVDDIAKQLTAGDKIEIDLIKLKD
jgi:preprotein translocase subunit SecD